MKARIWVALAALCLISALHELSALGTGRADAVTLVGLVLDLAAVPLCAWLFRRTVTTS